jgi:hypothetical protein
MHPVLAREAIQTVEAHHQEQVERAELDLLARTLRRSTRSTGSDAALTNHPVALAITTVITVLLAVVAF